MKTVKKRIVAMDALNIPTSAFLTRSSIILSSWAILSFFVTVTSTTTTTNNLNLCQQSWRYPEDCQPPNCTYHIVWRYKQLEDAIEFIITTGHPKRWTGIIFTHNENVTSSDGIFGWIDGNNYVMMDAHLPNISKPISDKHQSVTNISAHLRNGMATFRFTRKRNTQDDEDISFADDSPCPWMIFPVDGGTVDYENKTIITNENQPYISDRRICIKQCEQPSLPSNSTKPARPQIPFPSPMRDQENPKTSTTSTTTTTTTTTTMAPTSSSSTTTTSTTSKPTRATRPSLTSLKPKVFTTSTTTTRRPPSSSSTTTTTTTTTTTSPPTTTSTTTTPAPTTTSTTTTSTTQTPTSSSTTTTTTTAAPVTTRRATSTTSPPTTTPAPLPMVTTITTTSGPPKALRPNHLADLSSTRLVSSASSTNQQVAEPQWCVGRWSHPANCRFRSPTPVEVTAYLQAPIDSTLNIRPLPIEQSDCGYFAQWQYLEQSDSIEFLIQTKTRNKWIGIGFGNTTKMANSDAIIGLFEEQAGRHFIMDTWLKDHVLPEIDQQQNIERTYAKRENGTTTLRFRRARLTGDPSDFQFTDDNCAYFFFPTVGGSFNAINKRMHKHEVTPSVSEQRICVKSCSIRPKDSTNFIVNNNVVSTGPSSQQKAAETSADPASSSSSVSSSQLQPTATQPGGTTSATSTTAPNLPEKNPDSTTNINLSPSNDLSAELDGSSTSPTTASGGSGGHSNPFSRLAFLSEPSLRWLAGIGCVATLLAMIVFQACFTVYKNKQAHKQNLYRQSAFKQNAYLHGAYLSEAGGGGTANNLVHHRHQSSTGSEETQTASLRNSGLSKHSTSKQQLAASTASVNAVAAAAGPNSRTSRAAGNHHHYHHHHRPGHHMKHNHHHHYGANNPLVANVGQMGPAGPFVAQVNRSAAYDNYVTPSASESSGRDDVAELEEEDDVVDEEDDQEVDEDVELDGDEIDEEDLNDLEDYDDDMIMDNSFDFNNQHRPLHAHHHPRHHSHHPHQHPASSHGHPLHPSHHQHHRHSGFGHQRHHNGSGLSHQQHYQASRMGSAAAAAHHGHHQNQSLHRQQPQQVGQHQHQHHHHQSQLQPHYRSAGHLLANQAAGHHRSHHLNSAHRSQAHHHVHGGGAPNGNGGPAATAAARPDSYFLPSQRRY